MPKDQLLGLENRSKVGQYLEMPSSFGIEAKDLLIWGGRSGPDSHGDVRECTLVTR